MVRTADLAMVCASPSRLPPRGPVEPNSTSFRATEHAAAIFCGWGGRAVGLPPGPPLLQRRAVFEFS